MLGVFFDMAGNILEVKTDEYGSMTYHTKEFNKRFGPRPVVSPHERMGHRYQMYPELSRSGATVLMGRFIPPVAIVGTYALSVKSETKAITEIAGFENIDTATKIRFLQGF